MANPTITNNSPAAGSIAWTAFGIQYNGQSFAIPAGSSSKKFVWWLYGGGTAPSLVDGDTLPTLGADDMLLFLNKSGVGVLVPATDVLEGSLIVNGSILAPAIAANEIQSYHLSANSVTANAIAANAVAADDIQAGAVTTDKLAVGTITDSLVTNGSFEEFDATNMPIGWKVAGATNGTIAIVSGVASSGSKALQFSATGSTSNLSLIQTPEKYIPVSSASGRKWYLSMRAGAGTATTNGAYLRANWYDANKAYISYNDAITNQPLSTTWQVFEGQVTPPATARYMGVIMYLASPNVATNMYIDEVIAREVVVSAIIADGAITTPKMTANTINGDRIQAGTLTADKITAGSITTDRLLITDRTNYWENPDFESDTVGGIPKGTTLTSTTNARVLGAGSQGSAKSLEVNALSGSNNDVYGTTIFAVEPGDQYYIQYDYKFLNTVGTGNAGVGFRTYGPTKAPITWSSIAVGSARPTTWQQDDPAFPNDPTKQLSKKGIYTVPTGTYYLQPWITFANNAETTNRFHVDNIMIRRMSGGELIVDGAIIAAKLATDSVTSDKIQANAVIAGKISANAVVANSIAANAIGANHIAANAIQAQHLVANSIDGKTIRGATVIGGEIKTTDVANAISARMGPTAVYALDGSTTYPGIGFVQEGNTAGKRIAGLFSVNGPDVTLTQGGDMAYAENQAYLQLQNDIATLYARQSVDITGRNGANVISQVGTLNLQGNQVNLKHTNGLLVNGKDVTQASVQSWMAAGTGLINAYVSRVSPLTADAPNSTDTTIGTLNLGNSVKITSTGVYDVTVGLGLDAPSTGRSFVELSFPNGGPHRAYFGPGEDTVSVTATGVVLAANDIIYANVYQTTGGTRNYNARFRITKVAAPVQLNASNTQWQSGSVNLAGDLTVTGNVNILKPVSGAHWSTQSGPSATFYSDQIPTGTLWGPGKPPAGSDSTDTGLISWPANDTIQFRDTGVYSLSVQCRLSSGVTAGSGSQTFVSFEPTTNNAQNPAYAKGIMPYGDNQMSASVANVRMQAGQQIKVYIVQYTGATVGMWWRINVTRIG